MTSIYGHEVAGSIESIGEETEGFKKDDKVLVFPWIGEGLVMLAENEMRTFATSLDLLESLQMVIDLFCPAIFKNVAPEMEIAKKRCLAPWRQ